MDSFALGDIVGMPPRSKLDHSRGVTLFQFAPPHDTALTHPPIADHSKHVINRLASTLSGGGDASAIVLAVNLRLFRGDAEKCVAQLAD